jgi:glycine C-acetyltransferase
MKPIEKNDVLTGVINSDEIISGLCNKYFHTLKNKEVLANLRFRERVGIAHEIITKAKEQEVYFYRRAIDESSPVNIMAGENSSDNPQVNLASNDYLGFTKHPALINAGAEALEKFGTGSGSVPMLVGTTSLHKELERELANFTGYNAAISFSSCYAANHGLLTTLLTSSDVAILDMFVHASIIDGCCNTNVIFFKHNDPASLKSACIKASAYKNKLVIVDGVYSMDGDIVILDEIMQIAKENDAWVMMDESHAIGVTGDHGEGTHDHFAMDERVDIVSCSLGKALGGIGGFIAGSERLISFIELTCRPFIFSTSLPQNVAAQLIEAIRLLQTDPSNHKRLWRNIDYFKQGIEQIGFNSNGSESAIIPLIIPDEIKLLHFCQVLHDQGIFVNPIFFPVVPRRRSRIRISVTASLTKHELDFALSCMEKAAGSLSLIK